METSTICLLLAIGVPLLGFLIPAWAGERLGRRVAWAAFPFPIISFIALLILGVSLPRPLHLVIEVPWVPSLGVNLSFLVDGLSLFMGLVVSGMGCLVFFYAGHYLDEHFEHHGRFYAYLVLFMAAMLGTVFANNLLLMFVFWELTGLASFLLIGFHHGEDSSRVGARQALLVTAGTGLVLLAGLIMIYEVTGNFEFSSLVHAGLPWSHHGTWLTVAMVLVLIGAFGKSAQFPFHFWLPNAMAAPTPVSAYLHSATMVKLGVFLCARLFPLFAENPGWAPLTSIAGLTTMALCAVLALLAHDLKAILAFSTCSQLGFLIGYYGLGPVDGVEYDYLHILNHVLYKGSLFMIVGVVAHAAGIRDIRQLGGLFRRLPLLGVATLVAAAAMAGLPGTTGFISKEMMLKEIFEVSGIHAELSWFAIFTVLLTSVVKVAFATRLFAGLFLGAEPPEVAAQFHRPSLWIQLPPVVLSGAALVFGVMPGGLDAIFQSLAVEGLNRPASLSLWHGFTRELLASALMVGAGFGLYAWGVRTQWRWHEIPRSLRFDRFFEAGLDGLQRFAKGLTRWVQTDTPTAYLPLLLSFVVLLVGGTMAWSFGPAEGIWGQIAAADWTAPDGMRGLVAGLIILSVAGVLVLRRWTTQLISLSAVGFLICFYFVLYRAPDLALTQILIEVVTLLLILFLLGRFPKSAEEGEIIKESAGWRRFFNACLALAVGLLACTLVLITTSRSPSQRLGDFFLAQTVPLAEGRNAVNTILVDFRGFDTWGEITVLLIAALGCLGLLMRYKRSREEYRQGPMGPPGFGVSDTKKEDS